ncbi:hypothetical protein L873DRAFT_1009273 [Choiromyces venosus 120613-1]|uniref:Uncharacterized protein n=1 Tax=Choiromyces venosus 120613-1 TaxID=1336337 RepID=A0A3N4JPK2_9PEZI|nr:hypothetical protein L873DRAFT_1009273 [Choiromyces venosus 120613-1]
MVLHCLMFTRKNKAFSTVKIIFIKQLLDIKNPLQDSSLLSLSGSGFFYLYQVLDGADMEAQRTYKFRCMFWFSCTIHMRVSRLSNIAFPAMQLDTAKVETIIR